MTYCGYVEFLMVLMFILLVFLVYFFVMLWMIILMNQSMLVFSMKMFFLNFFSDLEIFMNIWSILFLSMVIMISSMVLIFTLSYFANSSILNFLFLYVSFVLSMSCLILSNSFYWMMLGWDGLGVVSFLLIVYYMSNESIGNGLFTLFQNRVGDLFFVLFMLGMLMMNIWSNNVLKWGIIFLLLGACVKSAQFPFNAWLLSAMSAPTPISSLVHSSTLVVAGVYILLQFSYCLSEYLSLLKFISLMTLIFSSLGLLNETDMKKLIAYSTMSHVALMMYLMSFQLFKIVYFHLNIHAMFKSLMFMCFGFVMLVSFHAQDKRFISLTNLNPFMKLVYYYSCLCLGGLPFLSAFFSKDLIIEKLISVSIESSFVVFLLLFLSISIYYSMKLLLISNIMFSMVLLEKNYMSMFSVIFMSLFMILIINIYLTLVFSLNLEILNLKLSIYIMIFMFFFLSIFTNLNLKFISYKILNNMKEIWYLNLYNLDIYIYANFFFYLRYMNLLNLVKIYLLVNWWSMFLVIFLF